MKASKMTNEELASFFEKNSTTILRCTRCGDETPISDFFASRFRESAARLRRPTPVDDDLLKMARDIDRLRAKLKVAEDALQKIFNKVFVDCEVAEIANNALAAIREEGGNDAH